MVMRTTNIASNFSFRLQFGMQQIGPTGSSIRKIGPRKYLCNLTKWLSGVRSPIKWTPDHLGSNPCKLAFLQIRLVSAETRLQDVQLISEALNTCNALCALYMRRTKCHSEKSQVTFLILSRLPRKRDDRRCVQECVCIIYRLVS